MSIDRIARGHANNGDVDLGVMDATLAVAVIGTAGSTLEVTCTQTDGDTAVPEPPITVVWNGHALTRKANNQGVSLGISIWLLENAPAGSGSLVASWGNPHWLTQLIATEVTGAAASAFDVQAANTNTSTAPSSGATAATAQANEMLIGAVALRVDTDAGSFVAPFAGGQSTAGNDPDHGGLVTTEGFASVAAIAAYTLSKTGTSNGEWAAAVVGLKEASSGIDGVALQPFSTNPARSFEIGI